MTEQQAIQEMRRIERDLMHLANNASGNSRAVDHILAAQAALYQFRKGEGG